MLSFNFIVCVLFEKNFSRGMCKPLFMSRFYCFAYADRGTHISWDSNHACTRNRQHPMHVWPLQTLFPNCFEHCFRTAALRGGFLQCSYKGLCNFIQRKHYPFLSKKKQHFIHNENTSKTILLL